MTALKKAGNLWYMLEADGRWYYIRTAAARIIMDLEKHLPEK